MDIDVEDDNYFMVALFFALVLLLVDGFPELVMAIQRVEVFYKQKQFYFYPAWAYAMLLQLDQDSSFPRRILSLDFSYLLRHWLHPSTYQVSFHELFSL